MSCITKNGTARESWVDKRFITQFHLLINFTLCCHIAGPDPYFYNTGHMLSFIIVLILNSGFVSELVLTCIAFPSIKRPVAEPVVSAKPIYARSKLGLTQKWWKIWALDISRQSILSGNAISIAYLVSLVLILHDEIHFENFLLQQH